MFTTDDRPTVHVFMFGRRVCCGKVQCPKKRFPTLRSCRRTVPQTPLFRFSGQSPTSLIFTRYFPTSKWGIVRLGGKPPGAFGLMMRGIDAGTMPHFARGWFPTWNCPDQSTKWGTVRLWKDDRTYFLKASIPHFRRIYLANEIESRRRESFPATCKSNFLLGPTCIREIFSKCTCHWH